MTCVVEPRKTVRSTMPGSRLAPVSPGSLQLDALGPDDRAAGPAVVSAGACASRVNSPNRTVRVAPLPERHSTSSRLATPRKSATNSVRGSR